MPSQLDWGPHSCLPYWDPVCEIVSVYCAAYWKWKLISLWETDGKKRNWQWNIDQAVKNFNIHCTLCMKARLQKHKLKQHIRERMQPIEMINDQMKWEEYIAYDYNLVDG